MCLLTRSGSQPARAMPVAFLRANLQLDQERHLSKTLLVKSWLAHCCLVSGKRAVHDDIPDCHGHAAREASKAEACGHKLEHTQGFDGCVT